MYRNVKILSIFLSIIMLTTVSTAQETLWGTLSPSSGGGGTPTPGRLIVYGDSTSSTIVQNPETCLWCTPLINYGFQIMNTSRGGARSYDNVPPNQNNACASTASGSLYGDYVGCAFFGERSVKHFEGACRRVLPGQINQTDNSIITDTSSPSTAYPGDTTNLSCLVDLPHAQKDVVVLGYGTNDIGTRNPTQWAAIKPTSLLAWNVILDEVEDRGLACVVVLGVPFYSSANGATSDTSLQDLHASLRAEVSANRPLCVVAEVHSVLAALQGTLGTPAYIQLFREGAVSPPTCTESGGVISGCIHLIDGTSPAGVNPLEIMGDIILAAVQQAVLLKSASL